MTKKGRGSGSRKGGKKRGGTEASGRQRTSAAKAGTRDVKGAAARRGRPGRRAGTERDAASRGREKRHGKMPLGEIAEAVAAAGTEVLERMPAGRRRRHLAGLRAGASLHVRSLLEVLPRLSAKGENRAQALALLEDGCRETVARFFADLRARDQAYPPELPRSLEDVVVAGFVGILENAILMLGYETEQQVMLAHASE